MGETYLERVWDRWGSLANNERLAYSAIALVAIAAACLSLWTAVFGAMEAWLNRSIHLFLVLLLVYLMPGGKKGRDGERKGLYTWRNYVGIAAVLACAAYSIINYEAITVDRAGSSSVLDQIVCAVLLVLIVDSALHRLGLPIASVAIVFFGYLLFGHYLPGPLAGPSYSYRLIANFMYNGTMGIFGTTLGVSSTYIIIFLCFGSFLVYTKAGDAFMKLAFSLGGGVRGGPALAAVIASALVGTIHGSSAGNVVMTGSFTIPAMKKMGYKPHFAAAVEAAASTGGIILPPVMGSTAFIMAEFLRIPYNKIVVYAAIPALLYFFGVGVSVYLEALHLKLGALPPEERPPLREALAEAMYLAPPLTVLIWMLLAGRSAMACGAWATGALILTSFLRRSTRLTLRSTMAALESTATGVINVAVACAAAGVVVGCLSMSGLAVRITSLIEVLSGGYLLVGLVLTMLVSIILGMGMPVQAVYIIVSCAALPAIIKMGVPLVVAHMFVFYYAALSAITPPMALASYTAAPLAGADSWATGWAGFRLALSGLVVPYLFVYNTSLLLMTTPLTEVMAAVTAAIGVVFLSISTIGYLPHGCTLPQRVAFFIGALLLIGGKTLSENLAGLLVVGLALLPEIKAFTTRRVGTGSTC